MEKLIVQKPFEHNGVSYHQGMEFKPRAAGDAEARLKDGSVRKKVFGVRGQKPPAPERKMEIRKPEQKLAEQTIEKAEEPEEEQAAKEESETEDEESKPSKRRGRPRLSPKKDD